MSNQLEESASAAAAAAADELSSPGATGDALDGPLYPQSQQGGRSRFRKREPPAAGRARSQAGLRGGTETKARSSSGYRLSQLATSSLTNLRGVGIDVGDWVPTRSFVTSAKEHAKSTSDLRAAGEHERLGSRHRVGSGVLASGSAAQSFSDLSAEKKAQQHESFTAWINKQLAGIGLSVQLHCTLRS